MVLKSASPFITAFFKLSRRQFPHFRLACAATHSLTPHIKGAHPQQAVCMVAPL
jgi:hypothetical protein